MKCHTEINHRNLDGIYTDVFLVACRQDVLEQREQRESTLSLCRVVTKQTIGKSLGEIFYEMLLRKKSLEKVIT